MVDAYIIDSIEQARIQRRHEYEGCRIQLELPVPRVPDPEGSELSGEVEERGVIVIPLDPNIPLREL